MNGCNSRLPLVHQQWHTAKFRIDDPQFVNDRGFNFVLESNGNEYNK